MDTLALLGCLFFWFLLIWQMVWHVYGGIEYWYEEADFSSVFS